MDDVRPIFQLHPTIGKKKVVKPLLCIKFLRKKNKLLKTYPSYRALLILCIYHVYQSYNVGDDNVGL